MRYALQTDSVAAHVQFDDGVLRWVVFNDDVPIASFPSYEHDFEEALSFHNYKRLRMLEPSQLAKQIAEDRKTTANRWRLWARNAGEEQEAIVAELLEVEADYLHPDEEAAA